MPSRPTLPALPHAAAARRLYQLRRPLSTGWQARRHSVRRNDRLSACYGNPRLRRSGSRGVRVRARHRISRSGSPRRFQTSHVATGTRRPASARPERRARPHAPEAFLQSPGARSEAVPDPAATACRRPAGGPRSRHQAATIRPAPCGSTEQPADAKRGRRPHGRAPLRRAGARARRRAKSAGTSEGWPARWRSRRRRSPTAARAGGTIAPSTASVAARPESRATPPPAGRRRWPPNRGSHATA